MKTRGFEVIRAYANKKITIPVRKTGCSAGYDIAVFQLKTWFHASTTKELSMPIITIIPTMKGIYS